jgi:hypothetical protein
MKVKPFLTNGIAILLILGFLFVFYQMFQGVTSPVTTVESFNEALWETWAASIVIISFIIFAGGLGILVLVGGGWRWE